MRNRLLLVLLLALAPGVAHANGRYPTSVDVHFKPGDHDVIALAATWGLMISKDGGDTWGWICEGGVGFGGVYDPDYAFTSTGLLLATTTSADGLRLSRDFCAWDAAPPPLGSPDGGITPATFVSQVEVGPDGKIFAAAANGTDAQIYRSVDDGVSFTAASNPSPGLDWWETLVAAPSLVTGNETRLYLTGYDLGGGVKTRVMFRSDDSGSTWTPLPITDFVFGGEMSDLQIAAVSPDDPDLVFARVYQANGTTVGDTIWRSANAGVTWAQVFEADDDINVVLVRGNGDVVVATRINSPTGLNSGVSVSTNGGVSFGAAVLATTTAYCLRERDDGVLYACADGFQPELMALGTGTVPGTYTSILDFTQVDDVIDCPAGTHASDTCDPLWCGITLQFGIVGFEDQCAVVDAGVIIDPPPDKSCTDCSGGGPGSMGLLFVITVAPLLKRRRRRN